MKCDNSTKRNVNPPQPRARRRLFPAGPSRIRRPGAALRRVAPSGGRALERWALCPRCAATPPPESSPAACLRARRNSCCACACRAPAPPARPARWSSVGSPVPGTGGCPPPPVRSAAPPEGRWLPGGWPRPATCCRPWAHHPSRGRRRPPPRPSWRRRPARRPRALAWRSPRWVRRTVASAWATCRREVAWRTPYWVPAGCRVVEEESRGCGARRMQDVAVPCRRNLPQPTVRGCPWPGPLPAPAAAATTGSALAQRRAAMSAC